jgi:hypothetical protein
MDKVPEDQIISMLEALDKKAATTKVKVSCLP